MSEKELINNLRTLKELDWSFAKEQTTYFTHALHPYPAKYIPQIPNRLIESLSRDGETVADIFCGSGTTLVEALALSRNCVGVDASPLACLVTKAKTSLLQQNDELALQDLVYRAKDFSRKYSFSPTPLLYQVEQFVSKYPRPQSDALHFWFEPFVIEELAEILSWCESLISDTARNIALTAFSSIVVSVSKQDSDTRYVRRGKGIVPGDAFRKFGRNLAECIKTLRIFTGSIQQKLTSHVICADVLERPDIGKVHLVVCSPPYPNAYSYHLYHMTRMLWLGMDQKWFKKIEIGSHRKYSTKGRNGSTAETFKGEMGIVFDWLSVHLVEERFACFVIGDSTVRGTIVDNSQLLSDAASQHGFVELLRIKRRIQDSKKSFNPAIGKIKYENILIFQFTGKSSL